MKTLIAVAIVATLQVTLASAGIKGSKKPVVATTTELAPADVHCPEGFHPDGPRCFRQVVQPLIPVCPEGILQPDHSCLILAPPFRVCPPEYANHLNTCTRTATAPATLSCPPGFLFEPGHKKTSSICTKVVEGPPGTVCPPGSIQTPGGCIVESVVLPAMSCPENTILTGQACVSVVPADCVPALGTKHGKKRVLEAVEDYEADENDLITRQLGHAPKKVKHVDGKHSELAVVAQQCERRTVLPPILQCPPNSVLLGRECVISTVVPAVAGPGQVAVETAPPVATCPANFSPCGGGKHAKKTPYECCLTEEAPSTLGCQNGFVPKGDICQAFRPAEMVCAESGYRKHAHKPECVRTQYVDPIIHFTADIQCVGPECIGAHMKHAGHAK